jgi:ribosome production factor 2
MMHFASDLFDHNPRFIRLKSVLMDFFNAEVIDSVCLPGLEHVISVSLAPTPPSLYSNGIQSEDPSSLNLVKVHIQTYTIRLLSSGTRIPRVELTPMSPFLDLSLRRHQPPDSELWKAAMKRPKMKKTDVKKGLGKNRKNMEVNDVGDLRGRVHVMKQDLEKLQTRKMKGLKAGVGRTMTKIQREMEGEVYTGRSVEANLYWDQRVSDPHYKRERERKWTGKGRGKG